MSTTQKKRRKDPLHVLSTASRALFSYTFTPIIRGCTQSQHPQISVPVYIDSTAIQQHRQQLQQQKTGWLLCKSWVQYYAIQWRWDVERFLARRLHKRWGH
ncbi:MAG TPA: hypothetical protein VL461_05265 [Dictyobacter sp.]|jgi:hypothetical protein|nr:hypothetical protein [Dictyobacter sp.]